jgi:hypothetical protein
MRAPVLFIQEPMVVLASWSLLRATTAMAANARGEEIASSNWRLL